MVDSTATVNRLGEESLLQSDRSILQISERKRTTQTVYMGGGWITQPFSHHKADSIEHVEIDTKRKE